MDNISNMEKQKLYWGKAIASFLVVLCLMPLGHAAMILMDHTLAPAALHWCAFSLGIIGLAIAVWGVFVKGDFKQTIMGLVGSLLVWTGWVEFLFQYFAKRYGVMPEIINGEVVTQPEYLILTATFGLYMAIMTYYIFSMRVGCNFISWWQKILLGKRRDEIRSKHANRHVSMVTFMEFIVIMWACYLLLMILYLFIGDHSPVTFAVGFACLVGLIFTFRNQLHLPQLGANVRMAIPTVIVFWVPVEIAGRVNLFNEIWVKPEQYGNALWGILAAFVIIAAIILYKAKKKA